MSFEVPDVEDGAEVVVVPLDDAGRPLFPVSVPVPDEVARDQAHHRRRCPATRVVLEPLDVVRVHGGPELSEAQSR